MTFNEEEFKLKAKAEVVRCRPGDWEHACRVVEWVKRLGQGRPGLWLLISAAYIHDIGWRDILTKDTKITKAELKHFEPEANRNSNKFSSDFLISLGYEASEIETIHRLILAADRHSSAAEDEAIIVDSDNLSKLDINHLKEKYQPSDWIKMYGLWQETFPDRIQTEAGRSCFEPLLAKLKHAIDLELKKTAS
jgi:hypothetical protein